MGLNSGPIGTYKRTFFFNQCHGIGEKSLW